MKSIASKLWVGMMALVMVVLVLLWLFQIVFLESFYTGIRVNDVQQEAAALSKLAATNREEFVTGSDDFAFKNNLSLELVDRSGSVLYLTGSTGMNGQMPMMRNNERAELFQEALAGREETRSVLHPRFGNKFMLMAFPVYESGAVSGVLYVNMPVAPVEDTAAILKRQLIYISLILLAAALSISYVISRHLTKPILEIKRAAEMIASGDYTYRIQSGHSDEIGMLARTINGMGQDLSQLEQLRKDLIANVSHELRTPLSLIRGYAETIRDVSGHDPEKRERQLGIIIEESDRLSRIVDDILNLSQLQAGLLELTKAPLPISRTIENVLKRYDVWSEQAGITLVCESDGELLVAADEARIEQVLHNLIHNAMNHTPDGGRVTVRATEGPDSVRVEIMDTGRGIPEDQLPHVWDRFYKIHSSKRRLMGTGLGLAIVKSVLEAHQASYGVASREGEGACFWFELRKPSSTKA